MIDGVPNRPLYFYQKDIIGWNMIIIISTTVSPNMSQKDMFELWTWLPSGKLT